MQRLNQTKYQYSKNLAIFSGATLLFGGVCLLQPFSLSVSSYAQSTNVDVSVGIAPVISISTDVNSVNLDVKPNDFGSIVSGDVSVNVGTNNASGYTLSLSSSNGETALLKDGTNTNISIPTLESPTTKSTWQASDNLNNKWGFTHDNTSLLTTDTYLPIPASNLSHDTTIKTTTTPATTSNTKVTFATKIDNTQSAGNYTNAVIFSAIANIIPNTYMQDFTAAQCKLLPTWQSSADDITLVDSRDNNAYVVRKLKDGNCWMVQNLRLTYDTLTNNNHSATLTSEDTNIVEFTLSEQTENWCGNNTDTCDNAIKHTYSGKSDYGTYYNWYTATAGTGTYGSINESVTGSICPKNWHLPTGGYGGEYYSLFASYQSDYEWTTISGTSTYYADNLSTSIGPDFVYSGQVGINGFYDQDVAGVLWTSTSSQGKQSDACYASVQNTGDIFAGTNCSNRKYTGRTVRCILSTSS